MGVARRTVSTAQGGRSRNKSSPAAVSDARRQRPTPDATSRSSPPAGSALDHDRSVCNHGHRMQEHDAIGEEDHYRFEEPPYGLEPDVGRLSSPATHPAAGVEAGSHGPR